MRNARRRARNTKSKRRVNFFSDENADEQSDAEEAVPA
jgi:hypothetical protein